MATFQQVMGVIIFVFVWVLLLKDKWKWLPLGRAMSGLLGSAAFVATGAMTAQDAYNAINLPTITLLTGCMLISAYMEKEGLFELLRKALSSRGSSFAFLLRVAAVSGLSSALLTNDTTCIIFTPVIGAACLHRKVNPAPYLLTLATCSNIGSACSPIGNPQNMIIALSSGLSFLQFLGYISISSVIGSIINVLFIAWVYRKDVFGAAAYTWSAEQIAAIEKESAPKGDYNSENNTINTPNATNTTSNDSIQLNDVNTEGLTSSSAIDVRNGAPMRTSDDVVLLPDNTNNNTDNNNSKVKITTRQKLVRFVLCCIPIALLFADRWVGLGWVTMIGAILLAVLDGQQPDAILARVDGNLLFFFANLFIVVAGFNLTQVPEAAWRSVADAVDMNAASGLVLYTIIILIGSNTVSNVPLVLLLTPKLAEMSGITGIVAWALLAFISTVAGNLTLLGSVANLIVAERSKNWYPVTFMEYLYVGAPSTIILCILGVPVVRWCVLALEG